MVAHLVHQSVAWSECQWVGRTVYSKVALTVDKWVVYLVEKTVDCLASDLVGSWVEQKVQ